MKMLRGMKVCIVLLWHPRAHSLLSPASVYLTCTNFTPLSKSLSDCYNSVFNKSVCYLFIHTNTLNEVAFLMKCVARLVRRVYEDKTSLLCQYPRSMYAVN